MALDTAAIIFITTIVVGAIDKILDRFYPSSRVNNIVDLVLRFLGTIASEAKPPEKH